MANIYIRSAVHGPQKGPTYIIEPVPQRFEKLSKLERIKNNPDFHLFSDYVAGTEEGSAILNLADHVPELASLYNFSEEIFLSCPERAKDWKFTGTRDVKKIRLDNFIDQHNISRVDHLDIRGCQGNNFDVLKSLGDKIDIVYAGVAKSNWLSSIYDDPENEHTVHIAKLLNDHGFDVIVEADQVRLPASYSGIPRPVMLRGRWHYVEGLEATIKFSKKHKTE